MSSTQQLLQTIDTLKANGHYKVTVTVLPSQIKRRRKSALWFTVRNDSKLSLTHTLLSNTLIMTKSVMISLLRKGNTGSQILEILNSLASGANEQQVAQVAAEPTLMELQFWLHKSRI